MMFCGVACVNLIRCRFWQWRVKLERIVFNVSRVPVCSRIILSKASLQLMSSLGLVCTEVCA